MMDHQLQQATEQLGRALRAIAPVKSYLGASAALQSDAEATGLLDQLSERQTALRSKQNDNTLTQADIDALRELQARVQAQPAIAAYLQAHQDLQALLPQLNYEISQLLGVDFAGLARKSGCC